MKLQTFTIYDSVHQQYFQPHHFENEGLSLRQFADLANEETQIAKNPEDYSLVQIQLHMHCLTEEKNTITLHQHYHGHKKGQM